VGECEQVAERTESLLAFGVRFLNHLGIQPHSRQLHKIFTICARQIDLMDLPALNNFPCGAEVVLGDAQFCGEDVHCADRQNAKGDSAVAHAPDDFVHGAISSRGNNRPPARGRRPLGNGLRISGPLGHTHRRHIGQRPNPADKGSRPRPACGGIQNYQYAIGRLHPFLSSRVA